MPAKHQITLRNGVEVRFYPADGALDRMLGLADTEDFLQETEVMGQIGCFPPFSLLVYDDILALGLYIDRERVSVGMRDYSNYFLIRWVDTALSLRKHPIRVVEKTTEKGEMFRRLRPRTELHWVEYDPETQAIREIDGIACPAQEYLESMPPTRDLYSLVENKGEIKAAHMRIDDDAMAVSGRGNMLFGIKCEGQGTQYYAPPIEDVERRLREEYPEALVVREPLNYCSMGISSKPWSCLACIFERVYEKKAGFEGKVNPEEP